LILKYGSYYEHGTDIMTCCFHNVILNDPATINQFSRKGVVIWYWYYCKNNNSYDLY